MPAQNRPADRRLRRHHLHCLLFNTGHQASASRGYEIKSAPGIQFQLNQGSRTDHVGALEFTGRQETIHEQELFDFFCTLRCAGRGGTVHFLQFFPEIFDDLLDDFAFIHS